CIAGVVRDGFFQVAASLRHLILLQGALPLLKLFAGGFGRCFIGKRRSDPSLCFVGGGEVYIDSIRLLAEAEIHILLVDLEFVCRNRQVIATGGNPIKDVAAESICTTASH